jgi:hypothetical protein
MASKKSKGNGTTPDQLLNKKEIKRIHDNAAAIAVSEDAKHTFVRSFDQPKRNHASQVCDEVIVAWNSTARSASTVAPLLKDQKQTIADDSKITAAKMKALSVEHTVQDPTRLTGSVIETTTTQAPIVPEAVHKEHAISSSPMAPRSTNDAVVSPAGTFVHNESLLSSSKPPVAAQPAVATASAQIFTAATHTSTVVSAPTSFSWNARNIILVPERRSVQSEATTTQFDRRWATFLLMSTPRRAHSINRPSSANTSRIRLPSISTIG